MPPGSIVIQTDTQFLRVALQNLITNAVEYTPEGGTVSCVVSEVGSGLQVDVSDTGCGIPHNAKEKIFTKFFRADNARTVKAEGNGLGLYITKSMIEALGGKISFTSKENKGTIFTILLPTKLPVKEI